MRVLITAGSTTVMVDEVRGISNIFTGKTGAYIARVFADRGCDVTILTSGPQHTKWHKNQRVVKYKTFDELEALMAKELTSGVKYDVLIHSAAVSDFEVVEVSIPGPNGERIPIDASKKISSGIKEQFWKLVQTKKLVDLVRKPWGFRGVLVKFKLLVGVSDQALIAVAQESREHSDADFIVANTLEGSKTYAFLIDRTSVPVRLSRRALPGALHDAVSKELVI